MLSAGTLVSFPRSSSPEGLCWKQWPPVVRNTLTSPMVPSHHTHQFSADFSRHRDSCQSSCGSACHPTASRSPCLDAGSSPYGKECIEHKQTQDCHTTWHRLYQWWYLCALLSAKHCSHGIFTPAFPTQVVPEMGWFPWPPWNIRITWSMIDRVFCMTWKSQLVSETEVKLTEVKWTCLDLSCHILHAFCVGVVKQWQILQVSFTGFLLAQVGFSHLKHWSKLKKFTSYFYKFDNSFHATNSKCRERITASLADLEHKHARLQAEWPEADRSLCRILDPCASIDIPSATRVERRNEMKHIGNNKENPEKKTRTKQKRLKWSQHVQVCFTYLFCKCSATKESTSEVWEAMECSTQGQAPQTTVGCHCFVTRNGNLYLAPH